MTSAAASWRRRWPPGRVKPAVICSMPVIAAQIGSAGEWTLDQLTELQRLLPEHVLLLTHVTIADLIVTLYRALAADDPARPG